MFEQCLWCCEKKEEGGIRRGRSGKCGRKCHEDRSRARGQTDPKLRAWLAEWVTESWKQIWTLVSDSCRLTAKQLLIERKAEQRRHWLTTRRASRPHNRTTGPWRRWFMSLLRALMWSDMTFEWREFMEAFHYFYYLVCLLFLALVRHSRANVQTLQQALILHLNLDGPIQSLGDWCFQQTDWHNLRKDF